MKRLVRTAVWAVGVAVVSAMAMPVLARADDLPPSLRSFADSKSASAYELSPGAGFSVRAHSAASLTSVSSQPLAVRNDAFVISTPCRPISRWMPAAAWMWRRASPITMSAAQPFLSPVNAPYLALANGGRYTGVTFAPASNFGCGLAPASTASGWIVSTSIPSRPRVPWR